MSIDQNDYDLKNHKGEYENENFDEMIGLNDVLLRQKALKIKL